MSSVDATPAQRFVQYLESPHFYGGGRFGEALASNGRALLVAAPDEGFGHVYVYENRMSGPEPWSLKLDLPRPGLGGSFGQAIAHAGDQFAIGASFFSPQHAGSGLVFIYDLSDPVNPVLTQTLFPSVSTPSTDFGSDMAMNDRWLAVVAQNGTGPSQVHGGVVYVFENQGGTWIERYRVEADDAALGDHLGNLIAIDGDLLLVGSNRTMFQGDRTGAAYLFELGDTHATQLQRIDRVPDPAHPHSGATFPDRIHIDDGELLLLDRARSVARRYARNPSSGIWEVVNESSQLVNFLSYPAGLSPPGVYLGLTSLENVYTGIQAMHNCWGRYAFSGKSLIPSRNMQWPVYSVGRIAFGVDQLMSGSPHYPRPANPSWQSYGSVFIWSLDQDFFDPGDCLTAGEVTCDVGSLHSTLPCPCGLTSNDPTVGCPNSTGQGGRLRGVGTPLGPFDDLLLVADQLPAQTTVVFRWAVQEPVLPAVVGAGISCLGNLPTSFAVAPSDATGQAMVEELPAAPNWDPAMDQQFLYQAFYRDGPTSPCGSALNATNGLSFSVEN